MLKKNRKGISIFILALFLVFTICNTGFCRYQDRSDELFNDDSSSSTIATIFVGVVIIGIGIYVYKAYFSDDGGVKESADTSKSSVPDFQFFSSHLHDYIHPQTKSNGLINIFFN